MTRRHALHRTSPTGQKFIGTCYQCGKKGLTLADLEEECGNVRNLTQGEALLEAIEPKDTDNG